MDLPNIFDCCIPRDDILKNELSDAELASDLAKVIKKEGSMIYRDAPLFFANTYPTKGLKNLLLNVSLRLRGDKGQISPIFRLDTNFGGGKTHALIALTHLSRGIRNVPNIREFIEPEILPDSSVCLAAFDGENADPINGHYLGDNICVHTPWGELAYSLAGSEGYEIIRKSDEQFVAPGADNIERLIGDRPVLILMDEIPVYLRKLSGMKLKDAMKQITAFFTTLFKAVESSPRAALVYTLAIGKSGAIDAYSAENNEMIKIIEEIQSVSARKATILDPTEEDETVKVLQRRLFSSIDHVEAGKIINAYSRLWNENKDALPAEQNADLDPNTFIESYPFHPALISLLREKLSTLNNFQRVRGMLRLLARTVGRMWEKKTQDAYSIHIHHIDLSYSPIRQEIISKLDQKSFNAALTADITAQENDALSTAEKIDQLQYAGLPPYTSYIARTIFFQTLAFNEDLKGVGKNELRYDILSPSTDIGFIDDAARRFIAESGFLDDNLNKPLRFLAEPNLTRIIQNTEKRIDSAEVHSRLNDSIRNIFNGSFFKSLLFPASPNDAEDSLTEKPLLAVMSYEAVTLSSRMDSIALPDLINNIFLNKNMENQPRLYRNNILFLAADEDNINAMYEQIRKKLAIEDIRNTLSNNHVLAKHQKEKILELDKTVNKDVAATIQQTYRHLFYPKKTDGSQTSLEHHLIELTDASEKPGSGQKQVFNALVKKNKILIGNSAPPNPGYISQCTPLQNRGKMSMRELRSEFYKNPALIMIDDVVFRSAVKQGINSGDFVYVNKELICGKGEEPETFFDISEQAFLYTAARAQGDGIFPKKIKTPSPNPDVNGNNSDGKTGTGGNNNGGSVTPPIPVISKEKDFSAEGLTKEIFERIWKSIEEDKFPLVRDIKLYAYDYNAAFAILSIIAKETGCEKECRFHIELEKNDESTFSIDYKGKTDGANLLKEFALPQLRLSNERSVQADFTIIFPSPVHYNTQQMTDLRDHLIRIASSYELKAVLTAERMPS